jgi:hypothetical protein
MPFSDDILQKLRINDFQNDDDKHECITGMINMIINEKDRILLCESGICDFICDTLRCEKSVKIVTSISVLIGYLGLSDKYRPVLFSYDVANIIVNACKNVHNIEDKLKIIRAVTFLCQSKDDTNQLINAGIIPQLCDTLKDVDRDIDKKFVSYYIYWLSYITYDKKTALEYNCIELMHDAAMSISNKALQSNIFLDMNYFLSDAPPDNKYPLYPLYTLWRTDFQTYLNI